MAARVAVAFVLVQYGDNVNVKFARKLQQPGAYFGGLVRAVNVGDQVPDPVNEDKLRRRVFP